MEINRLVLEKKIFEGFYHIWAWQPSWSFDPDGTNNISFLTHGGSTQNLALIGQAAWEKMFKIVNGRRQRTYAGAWVYYKLTFEPTAQVGELRQWHTGYMYLTIKIAHAVDKHGSIFAVNSVFDCKMSPISDNLQSTNQ